MDSADDSERFMKLKGIILSFQVSELQTLLQRAHKNAAGKKKILQKRALELLGSMNEEMKLFIYELHRQRFSSVQSFNMPNIHIQQNLARPLPGISARSTDINNHPTTSKRGPHPYAICESPKFRPMKRMEQEPSFPYPPSCQALPNTECPKLKPSSFLAVLTTIEKQKILEPHHVPRHEEVDISETREHCEKAKKSENMQLQISEVNDPDDFLPETLSVDVNGRPLPLPAMTAATLIENLNSRPAISEQESMAFVLKKFQETAADDIAPTTITTSLICPLGKKMIQKPCRSMLCTHVQCFDGETFIKMNEKKESWICPICDRTLTISDIQVDELWVKILKRVTDDCVEVEFSSNGTCNFARAEPKKLNVSKKSNKDPEIITIDTDSENECGNLDKSFPMHGDISDDDDDITCVYISPSISKCS